MNGGAWVMVEGQRVDIIYRDLDAVEYWMAEAQYGSFKVERLPFYLAGIPTYVVVGELALGRVLVGRCHVPATRRRCRRKRRSGGTAPRN